jgi:hypothetical protein
MALEQETAYFEAHKAELLEHNRGQFAVIHEDRLLGAYTRFDEAFEAGIQIVGNRPFLIRQIVEDEIPQQFPALAVGMVGAHS